MITEVKTEHKSDTLIVILIIVAILLILGTLVFNNSNKLKYMTAYNNGYGMTALANVPMPLYQGAPVASTQVYGTAPVYQPAYPSSYNSVYQPAQPVYTTAPTYAYVQQPAQAVVTTKPRSTYVASSTTDTTYPSTYYVKTTTTQTTPDTTVTYPYNYGYNYSNYNTTYPYNYGYNNNYNYNNGYYYNSNYNTNTAPLITLYGNNPYSVYHSGVNCSYYYTTCNQNTSYTEPGYRAYDNEDGDITSKVVITNNRNNYSYTGTGCQSYTIRYSVTDSSGNNGIAERVVNECYGQ